jgi:hypothetical protein
MINSLTIMVIYVLLKSCWFGDMATKYENITSIPPT